MDPALLVVIGGALVFVLTRSAGAQDSPGGAQANDSGVVDSGGTLIQDGGRVITVHVRRPSQPTDTSPLGEPASRPGLLWHLPPPALFTAPVGADAPGIDPAASHIAERQRFMAAARFARGVARRTTNRRKIPAELAVRMLGVLGDARAAAAPVTDAQHAELLRWMRERLNPGDWRTHGPEITRRVAA